MNKMLIRLVSTIIFLVTSSFSHAEGFTLTSPDIAGQLSNTEVFNGFGCSGENASPKLSWRNVPKGTKSFAVTVYDPDAPTGSGWWHWIIFDIPVNIHTLEANSGNLNTLISPKGSIQSITSFGNMGFGGACPPKGDQAHQYIFTVYALKTETLGLKSDSTPALVGFYLGQNTLAKASIIAYYSW